MSFDDLLNKIASFISEYEDANNGSIISCSIKDVRNKFDKKDLFIWDGEKFVMGFE